MKRSLAKGPLMNSIRLLRRLTDLRFGLTIGEISKELSVGRRQARRYVLALQESGIDVDWPGYSDVGEGRVRLRPTQRMEAKTWFGIQ